jgi:PAS domain S-box-containing protein
VANLARYSIRQMWNFQVPESLLQGKDMTNVKLLIVEFEPTSLARLEHLLAPRGYEIHLFLAQKGANIRVNIVDQVGTIKPDVLIIAVGPDPAGATQGDEEFIKPAPVGLEAVELLRQKSDIFVAYLNTWDIAPDLDPEVWERLLKTNPVASFNKPFAASEIEVAVKLALEMRRHRNALSDSEERFRTYFDWSSEAMFIKDESSRYVSVNRAMAILLNRQPSDIIGLTNKDLFEGASAERTKEVDQRVLRGESIEQEVVRRVNGVDLIFHEFHMPLKNADGNIVGIVGSCRDVTERRYMSLQRLVSDESCASQAMQACLRIALLAAQKDSVVLLLGESGCGKDFLARYIHDHSRAEAPFFAINCAAISSEVAESELFGHEVGAFTGAQERKRGLLELAEGGTLLLNEIGELTPGIQAKLLTFLDTRQLMRVGGQKNITVNARLMAATNRDLEKDVEEGRFRRDLFYRINVMPILVPPLRERREDIPILVQTLLQQIGAEMKLKIIPRVSTQTMAAFCEYTWPGNVRELRNVLERALILAGGEELELDEQSLTQGSERTPFWTIDFPPKPSLDAAIKDLTEKCRREAMRRSRNVKKRAAELLGVSRFKGVIRKTQKKVR